MKIGRNDPCPCGSGKKYKHCHLDRDGEPASLVDRALAWIDATMGTKARQAIREHFFAGFGDDEWRYFDPQNLDDAEVYRLTVWQFDWLLCEAPLQRHGLSGCGIDLLLAQASGFTAEERQVLQQLRAAPLRVYEVAAVESEEWIHVVDVYARDQSPRRIRSARLSEADVVQPSLLGTRFGARLVPDGSEFVPGAALYMLDETISEELDLQLVESSLPEAQTAPAGSKPEAREDDYLAVLPGLLRELCLEYHFVIRPLAAGETKFLPYPEDDEDPASWADADEAEPRPPLQ